LVFALPTFVNLETDAGSLVGLGGLLRKGSSDLSPACSRRYGLRYCGFDIFSFVRALFYNLCVYCAKPRDSFAFAFLFLFLACVHIISCARGACR
jgi:hypothetical protein